MAKLSRLWNVGDVFLVPLPDGSECIGQVLGKERSVLNSVVVALFDLRGNWSGGAPLPALRREDVYSALFCTRELLNSGRWTVVGQAGLAAAGDLNPYEDLRASGFVGAKVHGAGLVQEFVEAFFGLAPWDDWYLPDYLDGYLISPDKKPVDRLVYCGRHG